MAPVLPASLSPHICISQSKDLDDLLESSSLPPLYQILQSFSPLPNVTTRTTGLVNVPHASFALRFSPLHEIEEACREDENQRAARTMDWISERVSHRSAKWVEDMEAKPDRDSLRTPWWNEVKRCVEGDHVPSRTEGWNHPVSIILATSTTAPNPLQAITALHSRILEFPSWVDATHLLFTVIVHPKNSPLSDEEAGALMNAVTKQYGSNVYLLPLNLPSPPPEPVPVPLLMPRLPPVPIEPSSTGIAPGPAPNDASSHIHVESPNTIRFAEQDIQQTAKFTREFVVMTLVPWMEKMVMDWSEIYTSSRRLPSRLFSTTRRFFGSSSGQGSPTHTSSPSLSTLPTRSQTYSSPQNPSYVLAPPPSQHRRLAEFASILGDFKLAIQVWDVLRKEGKDGADILPLLVAPTPTVQSHFQQAISAILSPTTEVPPQAQLRALAYAVRWDIGISETDLISSALEGDRWMVSAAGPADEPPSALLLAQAALLSVRKGAKRRAALWYFVAARRLEKSGIKPLTTYLLRRAHGLLTIRPEKSLSPLFWESEGRDASEHQCFDFAISGVEHPLGRLLYSTGDVSGAMQGFLDLLRWTSDTKSPLLKMVSADGADFQEAAETEKMYLEDFRAAFSHFKSVEGDEGKIAKLQLPLKFIVADRARVRLPRDSAGGSVNVWEERMDSWAEFWRNHGKERLERTGKAAVGETFYIDLQLRNPTCCEITLSNISVLAQSKSGNMITPDTRPVNEVTLGPKEGCTVSVAVTSSVSDSLVITHATYAFLGLLPANESLSRRGRRLHDTPQQRWTATYASDVELLVEVEEAGQELGVTFVDETPLVLADGEYVEMKIQLTNQGTQNVGEAWIVPGLEDSVWISDSPLQILSSSPISEAEVIQNDNVITPATPLKVPLSSDGQSFLPPGACGEMVLNLRATRREQYSTLCLLFVFREGTGSTFHCKRITRDLEVVPSLQLSAICRPSGSKEYQYTIDLDVENVHSISALRITQVAAISPTWTCEEESKEMNIPTILAQQTSRICLSMRATDSNADAEETRLHIAQQLRNIIRGHRVDASSPPPLNLHCSHSRIRGNNGHSLQHPAIRHFVLNEQNSIAFRSLATTQPHIPPRSRSSIFPRYHPLSLSLIVFWELPLEGRRGHCSLSVGLLGAGHGLLKEIVDDAENSKVKRTMYAETQREKAEVLDAIKNSDWNLEMNPVVVTISSKGVIEHDFVKGPCKAPIVFSVRNISLTNNCHFTLKLRSQGYHSDVPCRFTGRTTFKGALKPCEITVIEARVWCTRPGTYSLEPWQLETEVGETGQDQWMVRYRYQEISERKEYITISHLSTT